ncbi:hypothetical protein, partial [Phocaeicola vulgatus]
TFAFGLYKGHYTYPMVAQFSTGILAHFSISIYSDRESGEKVDNVTPFSKEYCKGLLLFTSFLKAVSSETTFLNLSSSFREAS